MIIRLESEDEFETKWYGRRLIMFLITIGIITIPSVFIIELLIEQ